MNMDHVAVTSRSFSRHSVLREELVEKYPNVCFNDEGKRLYGDELKMYLAGFDKAIIALETIDEPLLASLPKLKVISKYGVGIDKLDLNAMRRHEVKLGWQKGVNRRSVSELALSMMISLVRRVPEAIAEVNAGRWQQVVGGQLTGKTVGIIGCGHVGKDLVKLLQPFNCNVLVNDIENYAEFYQQYAVRSVSLEELLKSADIVSLHVPFDQTTENILSAQKLSLMKPTGILLNLARGGLIDEGYLKKMLIEKKLAGLGLDVLNDEPPEDLSLLELSNVIITPHIGGSSDAAILAMGRAAIAGLDENGIP